MASCHREGCTKALSATQRRWCSEGCRSKARHGPPPSEVVTAVTKLLADANINPDEVKLEKMKVSEWEGFSKDEDGNPVVTPLKGTSIVLSPKWVDGPEWPVVQQAKPTLIKPVVAKKRTLPKVGKWRTAVILPDPQVGYRALKNGVMDPFHDESAMGVAMEIVAAVQPDLIVNLGDLVDFASHGRFAQEASFARTTQPTIDRAHEFLAEQRATCPDAKIVLLEGNHDRRLETSIVNNALAAFGLQRAALPESWPVMSLPHLLRLDDLDVEYVGGYPAAKFWINERLACAHAPAKLRSSGSSAQASIDDERVSLIFGHIHRIEAAYKTRNTRDGGKVNFSVSPGCLCRIDGAVPSTKGSTDVFGAPVVNFENWQHGVGVVTYQEGDADFSYEQVFINNGTAIFRGQTFGELAA